jgi:leucyl aminopeptidase
MSIDFEQHFISKKQDAIALHLVKPDDWTNWLAKQSPDQSKWLAVQGCEGKSGEFAYLADACGQPNMAVCVIDLSKPWCFAKLATSLKRGTYEIVEYQQHELACLKRACLEWGLSAYRFAQYQSEVKPFEAKLVWPIAAADQKEVIDWLTVWGLVRDLINLPAEDCTPQTLQDTVMQLADEHDGQHQVFEGEDLRMGFPAIYAVGRAGALPPRLVEMTWGNPKHPTLTIVGKGVCFDTGGLNLKPTAGIRHMKKDMGGAAHAIGLAKQLMLSHAKLFIRLLVPAVENAISHLAYRPGDIIKTRAGKSVEIDNTDAEGRLILGDAITYAQEHACDLLLDFATLTGAARVALGTDIPGFFTKNKVYQHDLMVKADQSHDPLWPLPLYDGYVDQLKTPIADLKNCASTPYGGAITAALYLQHFVKDQTQWVHFDMMAGNQSARPGRPEGGELQGLMAVSAWLKETLKSD